MKKHLLFIFGLVLFFIISTNISLAQNGLDEVIKEIPAYDSQKNTTYDQGFLNNTLGEGIGLVLSFIGILFLILVIYGGITWMTATGNDQKVEKAKNMIINAVIGLLIVLSAYAITNFIGSQLTN